MKISLTLSLILLSKILIAQDLNFTKEVFTYKVENLDTYERNLEIEGWNGSVNNKFVSIGANEDASLISYNVYELNNGKWKPSKIGKFVSESTISHGSFFNGSKDYIFEIPPLVTFRIEFNTAEKHTIFISQLRPKGYFDSESVAYNFELSSNLNATLSNGEVLEGISNISTFVDTSKNLSILIHPKNKDPRDYFSEWFASRVEPSLSINATLIPELLKLKHQTEDSVKFAKSCLDWVTQNIKYVAIENGINALIPRQCEKTIQNGLGDCKDMATLLTAIYKYFGYESYLGISRTNSKEGVFDFPSVGLANHMICALKMGEQMIFIDPTEDACIFGDPSLQIFGTETFLISFEGESFHAVPSFPSSATQISLNYVIDFAEKKIKLVLQSSGKMNLSFHHIQLKYSDYLGEIKDKLNYLTGRNWSLDSIDISSEETYLVCSSPLSASDYSNLGSRILYQMRMLPTAEKICKFFQWSEYPLFPSDFHLTIEFPGSKDQSNDNKTSLVNFQTKLEPSKDKTEYEKSTFNIQYKSLSNKPMSVQYPN